MTKPIPPLYLAQSQPAAAVPDGWVLVPREVTPEMLRAAQLDTELGAYACANLAGAYDLLRELFAAMAAAAPQAPQQAEPWRPIETAPRDPDGPNLLLSNGRSVHEGGWVLVSDPEDYTRKCYGWWDVSGGMLPEPTHWMPLPAPPATPVA